MPTYLVKRGDQEFEVTVDEGVDPVAAASEALGTPQPAAAAAPLSLSDEITAGIPAVGDPSVAGSISEEQERRKQIRLAEGTQRTQGQELLRQAGLSARVLPSAALKLPASLADLAGSALNVIPAGIEAVTGIPQPGRFPTGSTASVDALLNEIFPEPETFGERVVSGVGDIALTGVAGGQALAPKLANAARIGEGGFPAIAATATTPRIPAVPRIAAVEDGRAVPGILESIGITAAKDPKTFAALETTGAAGAVTAADLAAQADAGPGAQVAATLAGGLAGIVAPTAAVNIGRRTATGALNLADKLTKGELNAARLLQEATPDPAAAARAAREAPEGVLPARATEEPRLRALEEKVIADDAALEARVAADLEAAEQRSLTELADSFGPTSNKAEFQQTVIERASAPGTKIKAGQPDEMLDDAANSFNAAYKEAEGFPIRTENLPDVGPRVPLQTQLAEAAADTRVIAGDKTRKGISRFLTDLLEDVSRRGPSVGTAADVPLIELRSQDLIEMRQIIRQEVRTRSGPTASTKAKAERKLLQNADDAITVTLESQLPADAAAALRATDTRYRDFITVQGAVLRSGEKGLTPEALRASVKSRATSQGAFARGDVGELGALAERGKDIATTLAKGRTPGKPDQAARITRNMTPEQLQVAKADLNEGLAKNATSPTTGRLEGKKLLAEVEKNREVLVAAGFTPEDIGRIETIGKQLQVVQSRSPTAATKLLEDDVGRILNLFARIAGSKTAQRITKVIGGAAGLIIPQFTSKTAQDMLKSLNVDNTSRALRAAFDDKELFAALMVKPTDGLKRQAEAARTINAFLLEPATQVPQEEAE